MAEGPRTLRVGPVELGRSRPAVIVPLTAPDGVALDRELEALRGHRADIAEWRIDAHRPDLDGASHRAAVLAALPGVRERLRDVRPDGLDVPLLVSLRSAAEGGQRAIDDDSYGPLLIEIAEHGADLVDVEALRLRPQVARALIGAVRERGAVVVGSHHDHGATPSVPDMLGMLQRLAELGADIPKLAVTPRAPVDVLALLEAGLRHRERVGAPPAVTISMGRLGAPSRLRGPELGSCATFATVGAASAPGQIGIEALLGVLDALEG